MNEKLNVDYTYEIFSEHGNGAPKYMEKTPGTPAGFEENGWVQVDIPEGMSSDEFDFAVLENAEQIGARENGRTYSMWGYNNSNRYVYDVVTSSGGKVPIEVLISVRGAYVPGICGGLVLGTGGNCARRRQ